MGGPASQLAATAAGRSAFERVAGRWADHLMYGKSAPERPRCPYRIDAKVDSWHAGYEQARDEFMEQWHADQA